MLWIIVAIIIWGLVHSWLASLDAKEYVERWLGAWFCRFYRLSYNAFAVVSFLPVIALVRLLPDHELYFIHPPWLYVMLAGQAAAAVLLFVALLQTGPASFMGLRQVLQGEERATLVTDGLYRWVRHPLYLFGLLIIWLTPLMTVNLLTAYVGLTAFLLVGAVFEERKLAREFGAAYAAYKKRTPMISPLPFWRANKA